ncbi:MAG: DUF2807 domain-containing protein, partial [Bacteroidetes bacterium]|nr:DUF2807 domain-containing protein [Bacteroidota bacterium]
LLLSLFASLGCRKSRWPFCRRGTGEVVEVERTLNSFSGVETLNSADIYIQRADTQKVVVTARQSLHQIIRTAISGELMRLDFDGCTRADDAVTVFVWSPEINTLSIRGSGNIDCPDTMYVQDGFVSIAGSGSISYTTDAETLHVTISGSGDVVLGGLAGVLDIEVKGSGNVEAFGLVADECRIKVSGSGDCNVTVENKLDVIISGSGDVNYRGRPTVSTKITGSGNVTGY